METLTRPQLVYTPEGSLDFKSALTDRYRYPDRDEEDYLPQIVQAREEALEVATTLPGVQVAVDDGEVIVSTFTEEFLHGVDPANFERVGQLLAVFNRLATYKATDGVERIVGFDAISDRGSQATINYQFQRWQNSPDCLTEVVGKRAHEALLLPFESDFQKRELKDFRFRKYDDGYYAGSSIMIGVGIKKETFKITRLSREHKTSEYGEVDWFFPNISTLGNCACFGVDGMDRGDLLLQDGESKGLYEMHPHNVDYALQAFSQLLALGVLTYEASRYYGDEDIFEGIEWRQR
jgi:hypothetical protein